MNKEQLLKRLEKELKKLPQAERKSKSKSKGVEKMAEQGVILMC